MADIFDQFESNYAGGSSAGVDSFDAFENNYLSAQSPAAPAELPMIARAANAIQGAEDSLMSRSGLMGFLKGTAKAGTDVALAPADLLYRGGNAALDAVTGQETNIQGGYPSDVFSSALEKISGGEGNKTIEDATHVTGNLATVLAVPSQAKNIASKIPLLSKVAQSGGTGSGLASLLASTLGYGTEGAAITALMNPKSEALVEDMTTGAALNTAIPAVLKTGGNLARGLSSKLSDSADVVREKALGVQYGDRAKGLGRAPVYTDDAGNLVAYDQLSDAASVQAPIQEQIGLLKNKGLLADAPNAPDALKVHLSQKQNVVGTDIKKLIKEADQVIGKDEILPELTETNKYLATLTKTDRERLLSKVETEMSDYAAENPGGLAGLVDFKGKIGAKTNFDSLVPKEVTLLYRRLYRDFQKSAENTFDGALSGRAGELADTNSVYEALINVGKTVNKAVAKGNPSLISRLLKPEGSAPLLGAGAAAYATGLPIAPAVALIHGARVGRDALQAAKPFTYARSAELMAGLANRGSGLLEATGAGALPRLASAAVADTKDPQTPIAEQIEQFPESRALTIPSADSAQIPPANQVSSLLDRVLGVNEAQASMLTPRRGMKPEESKAFNTKVADIAKDLDADPADLLAVMKFETGGKLSSKTKNQAGSGATGLIQFMPSTAKELTGAHSKAAAIKILEDMTPTEQLDYVQKYLKPFKGKLNSLEDVYMAVLYPKAVGKDSDFTLFREGTKAYWQNRGLDIDKDGVITKAEATAKVKNYSVKA